MSVKEVRTTNEHAFTRIFWVGCIWEVCRTSSLECLCYSECNMPDIRGFLQQTFAHCGGAMSFENFMKIALFDPEHGYYTRRIAEVGGRRGDFATSATLSGGLGRAVAGWIKAEIKHHGWRCVVPVIEVGGGSGALARSVLRELGWWGRRRVQYNIVEISDPLIQQQPEHLWRYGVTWAADIRSLLSAYRGQALIVSNELVDAFPVQWLRWNAAGKAWDEIFVAYDPDQGLSEQFHPVRHALDPAKFSATALPDRRDGQRIELHRSYCLWLHEVVQDHWKSGSMLTIDYGAPTAAEIYHRQPAGTLRAYHRHQQIEGAGIYARIGKQDLTADVNFADLIAWGEGLGLETNFLQTQSTFLEAHGAGSDPMAGPGVGEAFQVLSQRRR